MSRCPARRRAARRRPAADRAADEPGGDAARRRARVPARPAGRRGRGRPVRRPGAGARSRLRARRLGAPRSASASTACRSPSSWRPRGSVSCPPAELAARLDHALPVLTGGARDAPERQQTLRATIDWSYELLDATEREAFARFAVFAGGATVAAAEAITGAGLDTLQSLADKQLLRRRGKRLTMLALVREYALERLAPEDAVHGRLAAWCIALAESEAPRAADAPDARAALDAEVPNAIAAMRWALASGADEAAADLVIAWGRYWFNTSRRADGRAWTTAALERAVDPDRRARLLLTRGVLAGARQRERFRADLQAALEYFRTTDDAVSIAECLGQLAFGHAWGDDYDVAVRLADEGVRFAERSGDDRRARAGADEPSARVQGLRRHGRGRPPGTCRAAEGWAPARCLRAVLDHRVRGGRRAARARGHPVARGGHRSGALVEQRGALGRRSGTSGSQSSSWATSTEPRPRSSRAWSGGPGRSATRGSTRRCSRSVRCTRSAATSIGRRCWPASQRRTRRRAGTRTRNWCCTG